MLRYALFSAVAFAFAGMMLGFMHDSEEPWLWYTGFTLIGAFAGAGFAFIIGRRKQIIKLFFAGALAGLLTWWLISTSEYDTWIQMTILGAVAGAFLGLAFGMLGGEKQKPPQKPVEKPVETPWECDECGWKISKDDNFCPGCGVEFE